MCGHHQQLMPAGQTDKGEIASTYVIGDIMILIFRGRVWYSWKA
jgi:hypothetical protein